ncbi:MAG: hypothetical protein ACYC26_13085 [Phycisphaerales bacterium]
MVRPNRRPCFRGRKKKVTPSSSPDLPVAPGSAGGDAETPSTATAAQQPIPPGPDLWAAALRQADRQPAKLSFLHDLKFTGMSGDAMRLVPVSRARIGFIRMQVARLSEWLSQLAHTTVRIQLEEPDELEEAGGLQPSGNRGPSQQEKAQAMNMPLVHQVCELFDATLIDLRDEKTTDDKPV